MSEQKRAPIKTLSDVLRAKKLAEAKKKVSAKNG